MPISMKDDPSAACFNCGAVIVDWRTRRGTQFIDKAYCNPCVRELCSYTAGNMLTPKERFARLLNRSSRNRILSPADIYDLLNRFSVAISYGRRGCLSPVYSECGWFAGHSLAWSASDGKDDARVAELLTKFWETLSKKKTVPKRFNLELAILLTISGDKHAIRHCGG